MGAELDAVGIRLRGRRRRRIQELVGRCGERDPGELREQRGEGFFKNDAAVAALTTSDWIVRNEPVSGVRRAVPRGGATSLVWTYE